MEKNPFLCIDLFAGAGGLSEGLKQAGFNCIFANELSEAHSITLKKNHSETIVETADIRELDPTKVIKTLGLKKGDLHLLAGGPPCQGFSVNAPTRSSEDKRNHLFQDFLRFVEVFDPKVVLIENVPGMVSYEKGETVTAILESLKKLGYTGTLRILFSAHYSVPQMRWRTIFIANKIGVEPDLMYPAPTHYAEGRSNFATKYKGRSLILEQKIFQHLPKSTTVGEAIGDLPPIENGGGAEIMNYISSPFSDYQRKLRYNSDSIYNHTSAGLGPANLARLPHIPPGGSWRDIPFDLLPEGMKRAKRTDHTKRYGRLDPSGLGSTILTKCDPHWGTYIHPEQDRIISVREAARIQSFPDHFRFYGTLSEQYEQVGNAVPPLFAKAIGETIMFYLQEKKQTLPVSHAVWQDPQKELQLFEEINLIKNTA